LVGKEEKKKVKRGGNVDEGKERLSWRVTTMIGGVDVPADGGEDDERVEEGGEEAKECRGGTRHRDTRGWRLPDTPSVMRQLQGSRDVRRGGTALGFAQRLSRWVLRCLGASR
jgi:hypothetical protein